MDRRLIAFKWLAKGKTVPSVLTTPRAMAGAMSSSSPRLRQWSKFSSTRNRGEPPHPLYAEKTALDRLIRLLVRSAGNISCDGRLAVKMGIPLVIHVPGRTEGNECRVSASPSLKADGLPAANAGNQEADASEWLLPLRPLTCETQIGWPSAIQSDIAIISSLVG